MPTRKRVTVVDWFKKSSKKTGAHKSSMWQKEQKSRAKRKSLRKIFFVLFLFGFFTTIYFLNYYRAIFYNPFHPLPTNIVYNSNPKHNYRVNILLISTDRQKSLNDLVLATYSKVEGTIKFLKIPIDVFLALPSDYGWGNLKNAYLIGQTEAKQKGVDVLVRGVEVLLAAPIDGYISVDDPKFSFDLADLESARRYAFSPGFLIKSPLVKLDMDSNVHTSLSPLSLARLVWDAKMVRFDKAKSRDLAEYITTATIDDQNYPILDTLQLDSYLKDVLAEPKILADLARVEVENSTTKPGLASLAARVINNLGGDVVYTGNSSDNLVKTKIIAYGKKDDTASRLGEVLGAKIEVKKPDESARGDIVIKVGIDFFERIHLK